MDMPPLPWLKEFLPMLLETRLADGFHVNGRRVLACDLFDFAAFADEDKHVVGRREIIADDAARVRECEAVNLGVVGVDFVGRESVKL